MALRQPLSAPAPYRVLLADDDEGVRDAVRAILERDDRFEVCGEASDAVGAVKEAVRLRPEVCLLDARMPGGGNRAVWEIKSRLPLTAVVMLSVSEDEDDLFEALRAGATGYLLKRMNLRRLPHALADAVAGKVAIPRELMSKVVAEFRDDGPRRRAVLQLGGVHLTTREWQVFDLLRLGLSTAEMAERLYVSPATVRTHIAAVLHKLGAPDRAAVFELFAKNDGPGEEVLQNGQAAAPARRAWLPGGPSQAPAGKRR